MKLTLALGVAALAAALTLSANATVYTVTFSGQDINDATVTHTGSFVLNGVANTYNSFVIDGDSLPASSSTGFQQSAAYTPGYTDALYQAGTYATAAAGAVNDNFTLDLSSLSTFSTANNVDELLTDPTQITANLDYLVTDPTLSGFLSTFTFLSGSTPVTAYLASITVTAVPEPASMALLATSVFGLGAIRRRLR